MDLVDNMDPMDRRPLGNALKHICGQYHLCKIRR